MAVFNVYLHPHGTAVCWDRTSGSTGPASGGWALIPWPNPRWYHGISDDLARQIDPRTLNEHRWQK